jgi:hypothetical protein
MKRIIMTNINHNPRYRYDCENCKFSWCCGYSCACGLYGYPDPPKEILNKVIKEVHKLNPKSSTKEIREDILIK